PRRSLRRRTSARREPRRRPPFVPARQRVRRRRRGWRRDDCRSAGRRRRIARARRARRPRLPIAQGGPTRRGREQRWSSRLPFPPTLGAIEQAPCTKNYDRRSGVKGDHMAVRVGINGFGRIGRSFYRAILARGEACNVELVAVNDPFGDAHTMAFLLKHDSVGGTIENEIKVDGSSFSIDGKEIKKLEEREPAQIPWADNGVEIVIESTGLLTSRDAAAAHLQGGAERVVISAPAGDADVT